MIFESRLENIYYKNSALEENYPIHTYGTLLEKFLRAETLNRNKYTTPFRFHFLNPEISMDAAIHFFILISKEGNILKRIYEIPCPKCKTITTIESDKLKEFYCEENDCFPEGTDFRRLVEDSSFLNKVNIIFEIDSELLYLFSSSFTSPPDEKDNKFTGENQILTLDRLLSMPELKNTLEDDDELYSLILKEQWEGFL